MGITINIQMALKTGKLLLFYIIFFFFVSSDDKFNLLFLLLGLILPMIFQMEILNPMEIL